MLRARCQQWDSQYDMLVLTLELSDAVKPMLETSPESPEF